MIETESAATGDAVSVEAFDLDSAMRRAHSHGTFDLASLARINDQPGMSLRDYFAGQALAGSLASWDTKDNERFAFHKSDKERAAYLADRSYLMADAMLEARATLSQSEPRK